MALRLYHATDERPHGDVPGQVGQARADRRQRGDGPVSRADAQRPHRAGRRSRVPEADRGPLHSTDERVGPDEYLTVREVAALFAVNKNVVHERCSTGELDSHMKRLGTVGKVRLVALSNAQAAHKAGLFTVRKAGSRPENSNGRRCGAATIPFVRIADTDAAEEEPDSPTGFAFPERHLRSGTVLPELVLAAWVSGEWAKRRAMAAVLPPANKGA